MREQICELLTDDDRIDASAIEVTVTNGEVILAGIVEARWMKRLVEDVVEDVLESKTSRIRSGSATRGPLLERRTTQRLQDKRHRA